MILPIDTGLPSHGLLLVFNVLHYHITVIVEYIMAFGVRFSVNLEAFKLHFGVNYSHLFI